MAAQSFHSAVSSSFWHSQSTLKLPVFRAFLMASLCFSGREVESMICITSSVELNSCLAIRAAWIENIWSKSSWPWQPSWFHLKNGLPTPKAILVSPSKIYFQLQKQKMLAKNCGQLLKSWPYTSGRPAGQQPKCRRPKRSDSSLLYMYCLVEDKVQVADCHVDASHSTRHGLSSPSGLWSFCKDLHPQQTVST